MSDHNSRGSRDTGLLLGAMGLNSLPFGFTLVVLPIYLSNIGFSSQVIGYVTSVSSIANTIALIPFAIAADRYGKKIFVLYGFLSATAAYLLFAFTRDLNSLLLASAIGGVGLAGGFSAAVWTPAWTALLAEKAPRKKRTGVFALSQGIWTIALTVGSAMSVLPYLFRTQLRVNFGSSFEYTFLIFAFLSILSGLAILPISERRVTRLASTRINSKSLLHSRSSLQIAKFSVSIGLIGFASGLGIQLLSLWFNKMYGTSETILGPWFAAAEATSLIVIPIVPRLTGSLGSPRSAVLTQAISALLLISMIFAPTYETAAVLFIARNFFINASWPIQQSYLMGTVNPKERASASAITYTVWGVGSSISPILAGYFLSGTSFLSISAPISIASAIYLVSAISFYYFFRNIAPPEERMLLRKESFRAPASGLG
ncbi:MAG: MFS transporter [Candidatus Bathyarchaeia archaeon]